MQGLILLQQHLNTDDETAIEVIEGAFITCLILIVLSNISLFSVNLKHNKAKQNREQKVKTIDRFYSKLRALKSIGQYARLAAEYNLGVNMMEIHLPTLFTGIR